MLLYRIPITTVVVNGFMMALSQASEQAQVAETEVTPACWSSHRRGSMKMVRDHGGDGMGIMIVTTARHRSNRTGHSDDSSDIDLW
jgi:hypothetical protein